MTHTSSKHLLLVEDEEHLAFMLEFNLSREGYQVTVATTLREARERLTDPYDLMIFDVMLPDGTAFDLCKELRENDNHTPVLFLTAKGASNDIVSGLEAGADDYMTKPFALEELFARIHAMLRRQRWEQNTPPPPSHTNTFRFRNNEIDFSQHTVTAQGKKVDLTALELRLLSFFVQHAEEVVSREQILEEVWEVSPTIHTRTVDNFLVRLRRVFENDPSNPQHFLTIRGAGYRFVPEP